MSEFFRRDKLKPGDKVTFFDANNNVIIDAVREVSHGEVVTTNRYMLSVTKVYPTKEALLESLVTLDYTK